MTGLSEWADGWRSAMDGRGARGVLPGVPWDGIRLARKRIQVASERKCGEAACRNPRKTCQNAVSRCREDGSRRHAVPLTWLRRSGTLRSAR